VIAGTGRPAGELSELLGSQRAAAVARELLLRAARWAGEAVPGNVHVAYDPADAPSDMAGLLGDDMTILQQEGDGDAAILAHAIARVMQGGPGPLLIVWPCLAGWRADHAGGALDDLADGCDVSVGPVFDGGFYLVALARPLPELFSSAALDWSGPDALGAAFAAAQEAGLTIGMLRAERGLRSPDDVRAALADPLTDPELRALLTPP
jgi:glycosyltransferase A (GT-A) superfamily protein (DUF2064 family)